MPDVFKVYQPNSSSKRPGLRACQDCYVRKVKCSIEDGGSPCRSCVQRGITCQPRSRKRKAAPSIAGDDGPRSPLRQRQNTNVEDLSAPEYEATGEVSVEAPLLFLRRPSSAATPSRGSGSSKVDKFLNSSFISRFAILGDDFPGLDHSHPERTVALSTSAEINLDLLRMHNALDVPDLPVRQSLFEAYVERCWTWMPVIDIGSFDLDPDAVNGPLLVLQAVMLVGALMRPHLYARDDIQIFYRRVKALIQSNYEKDPLNILAALCLIQWYIPAAPKDVSTDTPRFWNTYAIGLAQQMGLHRNPIRESDRPQLRRRIWFTLCARDNMTSAAHGRPRLLNLADSNLPDPTLADFPADQQDRGTTFLAYSIATEILGDLCQILTRHGHATSEQTDDIATRLRALFSSLPSTLVLDNDHTDFQLYKLDVAQLHIHILAVIAILHRPRSVFSLSVENATSVTAAIVMFRLFQAIELREHTVYLSSAFAWHLFVAAIPLLSCLRQQALAKEAEHALDRLEISLRTLGKVRPSAANNLKNVQAIRRALSVKGDCVATVTDATASSSIASPQSRCSSIQLLEPYGKAYVDHCQTVMRALVESPRDVVAGSLHHAVLADEVAASDGLGSAADVDELALIENYTDPFIDFLQADLLADNFWMRDWMDELRPSTAPAR